jgi:hypothetical protein
MGSSGSNLEVHFEDDGKDSTKESGKNEESSGYSRVNGRQFVPTTRDDSVDLLPSKLPETAYLDNIQRL